IDDVVFERVSGGEPTTVVIEEAAGLCGVDGSVDSDHSGYNGSGFANTDNATGNGVDWTVNVPSSGNYTLEWRYANGGSANRPGNVMINGSSQAMMDFPATGSWTSWTSASAEVVLSAGENTIRLQATASPGLGNIDSLTVTGDSPQAVDCGGSNPPDNSDIFLPDYIIGADVTWLLEHEYIGRTFSDNGQTQPLETILSNHGFNFIRIRTFVCPGCPGGYAHNNYSGAPADEDWADTAHTIEWAKRVKAEEMGIFLNFHLSDLWASIGEQHRPSAWEGMSVSQMSSASYNYAKGVLDQMVAEGVKPDMVQCGNENNTHVSGFSFNDWAGFSGIINACFDAVRDTDPDIITVAHHGRPRPDGDFASWIDRLFVWENPTIDADVICGSTYGTTNNGDDWEDMFNYSIDTTGKPVMSCEYSDNRRELVNDTFRFDLPNGMGWGAFLWEPHAFGDRRIFWLDGNVYRTTESMDAYADIAREEGLPVPHQR
ncbi:glycosyl hydrolase 53 family protein, partial [Marinimicrobium agarilyticum]|uniref:glycosyl hydrolase 53 family protein n=1 Tax=Marinimicrobium agarilyticum TaxID=306546 RepID=UPI0012F6A873